MTPTLRECRSPRILGLGTVEPDDCRTCLLRTEEPSSVILSASRNRLVPCHWLGERFPEGETYECQNSKYSSTSLENCNRCADYLFPIITSRMPVEDVLRHRRHPTAVQPDGWWQWENVQEAQRLLARQFLDRLPEYPGHDADCGIVVVGGGKYLPSAYVTCRVIRHLDCKLPIELWHFEGELAGGEHLFSELDVTFQNADRGNSKYPFRFLTENWWKGWQLKAYALLHSRFQNVLLLDADCYPLRNPEYLFESQTFRRYGAIFWPDIESSCCLLTAEHAAVFGLPAFEDQAAESGQLVVNRRDRWRELALAGHHNAQADFTYRILWGDKDTFPIAWKQLGRTYGRLWPTSQPLWEGIYQHDERGKPLFLHRCTGKFTLGESQFESTPGQHGKGFNWDLPLEGFCRQALLDFRAGFSPSPSAEEPG